MVDLDVDIIGAVSYVTGLIVVDASTRVDSTAINRIISRRRIFDDQRNRAIWIRLPSPNPVRQMEAVKLNVSRLTTNRAWRAQVPFVRNSRGESGTILNRRGTHRY